MQFISGPNIATREIFFFDKNLDGEVSLGTYTAQAMERLLRRARSCYAGNNRLNPIAGQLSDRYVLTSTRYGNAPGAGRQLAVLADRTGPFTTYQPAATTTAAGDVSGYNAYGGSGLYSANVCLTPFSAAKTVAPPKLGFTNPNVNTSFTYFLNVPMLGLSTAGSTSSWTPTTPGQLMSNGVVYQVQAVQSVPADYSYIQYGGAAPTGNAGSAGPTYPLTDGLTVVTQAGTAEQVNLTDGLFVMNGTAYKIDSFGFNTDANLAPGSRPTITFSGYWGQWSTTPL